MRNEISWNVKRTEVFNFSTGLQCRLYSKRSVRLVLQEGVVGELHAFGVEVQM